MKQILLKAAKACFPKWLKSYFKRRINPETVAQCQVLLHPKPEVRDFQYIVADTMHPCSFKSVYIFPVIDWNFRFQRPQHLARCFGSNDYKIFYFSTNFILSAHPGYDVTILEDGILGVTLYSSRLINLYQESLPLELVSFLIQSLAKLEADFGINEKIIKMDHPFWTDLARHLRAKIVYDCMDDHEGFDDEASHLMKLEKQASEISDFLILSSDFLYKKFSKLNSNCILIENACDYNFFTVKQALKADKKVELRPDRKGVVGYFGAIAHWFDVECVENLAKQLPEFDFILIGSTHGCKDIKKLKKLKNVFLLGEQPYAILPGYLALFDVCLIPFKIIQLTLATNPVKVFEYLSQGKPVVSTALPEVMKYKSVVYMANDSSEFVSQVKKAFLERNEISLINERIEVAKNNSWPIRFSQLDYFIKKHKSKKPKISVIVLAYNNLYLTKNCLYSIYKYSHYENLEVIVVDNASTDGTREWLLEYAKGVNKLSLILNNTNKGFSAGNNIGIKESSGDYVVILNNDTFVSPYWLDGLLKHCQREKIGMVGPVTNNIGNQAKIELPNYYNEHAFIRHAVERASDYYSRFYEMSSGSLAFFCVMIKRAVLDKVGLLDENFGLGWFEDDDYTLRVRHAGYKLLIADDVLIHHEHSASFNKLSQENKDVLFLKNKLYFEKKHNIIWQPHIYDR